MTVETTYSEKRGELFAAMAKAQAEITGAKKGASNPFFKSKYADLALCLDAIREPLSNNGLCVIQTTEESEGAVIVVTTLGHDSGEWMTGRLKMFPDKAGPQAVGSCITYARRYALAAITGLAQVDDDAETATQHKGKPDVNVEAVYKSAKEEAEKGLDALGKWYDSQTKPTQAALHTSANRWNKLKAHAADVDAKASEAA